MYIFFTLSVCLYIAFLSVSEHGICIGFHALIHIHRKTFELIGNAFGYCLCCYCN